MFGIVHAEYKISVFFLFVAGKIKLNEARSPISSCISKKLVDMFLYYIEPGFKSIIHKGFSFFGGVILMAFDDRKKTKAEREAEKLRNLILCILFGAALIGIIIILWYGVQYPGGVEEFFFSAGQKIREFFKNLRFDTDIYFRFFKSLFGKS